MPESKEKLDRFTAVILSEAISENERALSAFQEKRRKKLAETKKQADADARAYIHGEITRIRAEAGRQISCRMQESRRTLYQRRNQIAEEVFKSVRQKIAAYTAAPEYGQRLEELLRQALSIVGGTGHVRVYFRPEDQAWVPALRSVAPDAEFLEGDFQLGGLIAEAPDLGLRADSSFDSRLTELNGHFAELFGISLSDAE
ncbi:MAG: V-type ATP synthase subunit E family protein [Clostridiaceae bacterium]|nr:V-type ATP synthase subunit E family protein [Clostridiaceae bacterium]